MNWGNDQISSTEHFFDNVIAGDVETVRARVISALALFDYTVIESESVIKAGRGSRGMAHLYASADILKYPTNLEIRLKQEGNFAARAVFYYTVKHPMLSSGEKKVLDYEAEAIAAHAARPKVLSSCINCGTQCSEDSNFCRRCGASVQISPPAEVKLLQVFAQARAGFTWLTFAPALILLTFICLVLAIFLPEIFSMVATVALIGVMLTALFVGLALWEFNKIVKLQKKEKSLKLPYQAPTNASFNQPRANAELPPQPAGWFSVTEETTNQLFLNEEMREPVKIHRETGE